jgi:hypothetical protein
LAKAAVGAATDSTAVKAVKATADQRLVLDFIVRTPALKRSWATAYSGTTAV